MFRCLQNLMAKWHPRSSIKKNSAQSFEHFWVLILFFCVELLGCHFSMNFWKHLKYLSISDATNFRIFFVILLLFIKGAMHPGLARTIPFRSDTSGFFCRSGSPRVRHSNPCSTRSWTIFPLAKHPWWHMMSKAGRDTLVNAPSHK